MTFFVFVCLCRGQTSFAWRDHFGLDVIGHLGLGAVIFVWVLNSSVMGSQRRMAMPVCIGWTGLVRKGKCFILIKGSRPGCEVEDWKVQRGSADHLQPIDRPTRMKHHTPSGQED